MHSRKSLREKKVARQIVASVASHRQRIADGLSKYFSPFVPEGESLPDFRQLLDLHAAALESLRLDFQVKDRARLAEEAGDAELRRIRERATGALHTKMREINRTFDGSYGPSRCQELLGFGDELRREPEQIYEQAESAIDVLSAPGFELPPPVLEGVTLTVDDLLTQLAGPFTELATAIAALDAEKNKLDATVTVRQDAEQALTQGTSWHGAALENLYKLAGQEGLAERLRPRRRAKKAEAESPAGEEKSSETGSSEAGGTPAGSQSSETGGTSSGTSSGPESSTSEAGGTPSGTPSGATSSEAGGTPSGTSSEAGGTPSGTPAGTASSEAGGTSSGK